MGKDTPAGDSAARGAVMSVAAVETRVRVQLKDLRAVVVLVKDLAQAHDKYAAEFAKLPLQSSVKTSRSDGGLLGRVVGSLEKVLAAVVDAHGAIATELSTTVVTPLEAFEKQQHRQTRQILAEIDGAVRNEKQLHTALLAEIQQQSGADTTKAERPLPSRSLSNQEPELDQAESREVRGEEDETRVVVVRDLKAKRDQERSVAKQRLEELNLTDEQQRAVVDGLVTRCFEVFSRQAERVSTEILSAVKPGATACTPTAEAAVDPTHDEVVQSYDTHVDATSWMIGVFAQLLCAEESMLKRLQAIAKAHSAATLADVFGTASPSPTSAESTTYWDFMVAHRQLTVNLADPIGRTLRFSKQKQDTIYKELMESMQATAKAVQHHRQKLKEKLGRLHQGQNLQTSSSVSSPGPETAMMMGVGLSTFGLRSAVAAWSKQLQSPKKTLMNSKSLHLDFGGDLPCEGAGTTGPRSPSKTAIVSAPAAPKQVILEREVAELRTQLETMEKNGATQRAEMLATLRETATIGAKTMEFMVHDYSKNVVKAMTMLSGAASKALERLEYQAARAKNHSSLIPFHTMRLFEDDGALRGSTDVMKRALGQEEMHLDPENNASETETEIVDVASVETQADGVGQSTRPAETSSMGRREAVSCTLTELRDTVASCQPYAARVVELLQAHVLPHTLNVLSQPGSLRTIAVLLVALSFVRVLTRFADLHQDWTELAKLQRENALLLQTLSNSF